MNGSAVATTVQTTTLLSNGHRNGTHHKDSVHSKDQQMDSNNNHSKVHHSNGTLSKADVSTKSDYKLQIVWRNIFLMLILHTLALVGMYQLLVSAKYASVAFVTITTILVGMGVTVGAHRLWSHRSYEAKLPLRIFLMILNSASLQNDIYEWSRDHRVHHKFSDTDADPHNSTRGFFFAHMGWLLCKKHPDVVERGKTVSMKDLEQDPVVNFQRQFYKPLAIFFTFYLPTYIPYYFWGENYYTAFYLAAFRYTFSLHATWLVNSAAHLYGTKPYDVSINPRESKFVQYMTVGEGYHNYHHVFPFDYSASEVSWTQDLNVSTMFIDLCSRLGLAYNLKKVDEKVVQARIARTGDQMLAQVYHENHSGPKMKWNTLIALLYVFFLLPTGFYLSRLLVASLFS